MFVVLQYREPLGPTCFVFPHLRSLAPPMRMRTWWSSRLGRALLWSRPALRGTPSRGSVSQRSASASYRRAFDHVHGALPRPPRHSPCASRAASASPCCWYFYSGCQPSYVLFTLHSDTATALATQTELHTATGCDKAFHATHLHPSCRRGSRDSSCDAAVDEGAFAKIGVATPGPTGSLKSGLLGFESTGQLRCGVLAIAPLHENLAAALAQCISSGVAFAPARAQPQPSG